MKETETSRARELGVATSLSCSLVFKLPLRGEPVILGVEGNRAAARLAERVSAIFLSLAGILQMASGSLILHVKAEFVDPKLRGEIPFREAVRLTELIAKQLKELLDSKSSAPSVLVSRRQAEVGSLDISAFFVPSAHPARSDTTSTTLASTSVLRFEDLLRRLELVRARGPATLEDAARELVPLADQFLDIVAEKVSEVLGPLKDKEYSTPAERESACDALRMILDAYRRGLKDPGTGKPARPYGRGRLIALDTPDTRGATCSSRIIPSDGFLLVPHPIPGKRGRKS